VLTSCIPSHALRCQCTPAGLRGRPTLRRPGDPAPPRRRPRRMQGRTPQGRRPCSGLRARRCAARRPGLCRRPLRSRCSRDLPTGESPPGAGRPKQRRAPGRRPRQPRQGPPMQHQRRGPGPAPGDPRPVAHPPGRHPAAAPPARRALAAPLVERAGVWASRGGAGLHTRPLRTSLRWSSGRWRLQPLAGPPQTRRRCAVSRPPRWKTAPAGPALQVSTRCQAEAVGRRPPSLAAPPLSSQSLQEACLAESALVQAGLFTTQASSKSPVLSQFGHSRQALYKGSLEALYSSCLGVLIEQYVSTRSRATAGPWSNRRSSCATSEPASVMLRDSALLMCSRLTARLSCSSVTACARHTHMRSHHRCLRWLPGHC